MVSKPRSGFREIEHTADWELQVWAPDFLALLEQAARAMGILLEITLESTPRLHRSFELPFSDQETLLVDFLSELLFLGEDQGIAFDKFELKMFGNSFYASLEGAAIKDQAKEIKAVTYHCLKIRSTAQGLETNLVFDV
ncbi:MAG: archease [Chloroflexota bacterium]